MLNYRTDGEKLHWITDSWRVWPMRRQEGKKRIKCMIDRIAKFIVVAWQGYSAGEAFEATFFLKKRTRKKMGIYENLSGRES